jgi:tetratricopeptide (TPR) repeat protein
MGRTADADGEMAKALTLPGADLLPVHFYAVSLLASGRNDKALEIFQFNRRKHPEEKFWTYFGLARAYTALGDKKNAIENWETALHNVPDNRKAQIPLYEKTLKQLKDGK